MSAQLGSSVKQLTPQQRAHNGELHMVQSNPDHMDNTVGSQQQNIIVGTLLGDGFLERNGIYTRLICDHGATQKAYVLWKAQKLSVLQPKVVCTNRYDARTDQVYSHTILRTRSTSYLEPYAKMFYRAKHKIVPRSLPTIMNPQILAVWIMDDGHRRRDCNALRLNTQGYSLSGQRILVRALHKLALDATIQHHTSKFVIYIPTHAMQRLRFITRPYIAPTMAYKFA